MNNKLYRKEAMSKINSPEELNEFICVTNPSIWIILTALLVLLLGICCWGIFGEIETAVSATFTEDNDAIVARMNLDQARDIHPGDPVRINYNTCHVSDVRIDEERNMAVIEVDISLPSGYYTGEIVTGYIKPISFIFN